MPYTSLYNNFFRLTSLQSKNRDRIFLLSLRCAAILSFKISCQHYIFINIAVSFFKSVAISKFSSIRFEIFSISVTSTCVLSAALLTPFAPSSMACVIVLMDFCISTIVFFNESVFDSNSGRIDSFIYCTSPFALSAKLCTA